MTIFSTLRYPLREFSHHISKMYLENMRKMFRKYAKLRYFTNYHCVHSRLQQYIVVTYSHRIKTVYNHVQPYNYSFHKRSLNKLC